MKAKVYSLGEILKQGKIDKIHNRYRCSECNISYDTPFQALNCYKKCLEKQKNEYYKDPKNLYWETRTPNERELLRKEYNSSDYLYNKFESVSDYAYFIYKNKLTTEG